MAYHALIPEYSLKWATQSVAMVAEAQVILRRRIQTHLGNRRRCSINKSGRIFRAAH